MFFTFFFEAMLNPMAFLALTYPFRNPVSVVILAKWAPDFYLTAICR